MFNETIIPELLSALENLGDIIKDHAYVIYETAFLMGYKDGFTIGISMVPEDDGKYVFGFGSTNLIGVDIEPIYDVGDVGYDLGCSKLDRLLSKHPNITYKYHPNEVSTFYTFYPVLSLGVKIPDGLTVNEELLKETMDIYEKCIKALLTMSKPLYS